MIDIAEKKRVITDKIKNSFLSRLKDDRFWKDVLLLVALILTSGILLTLDGATSENYYAWWGKWVFWRKMLSNGFTFGASTVGILLLLPRKVCRVVFPAIFGFGLIFVTAGLISLSQFGIVFKGETVMIFAGSSMAEIKSFISMYANVATISAAIVFLVFEFLMMFYFAKAKYFKFSKLLMIFCLLCQLPVAKYLVKHPPQNLNVASTIRHCTALHFGQFTVWRDVWKSFGQLKELLNASTNPELPNRIGTNIKKNSPLLGIIVIGESSTRNRWSLYGYKRETNPLLGARASELTVFNKVTAPSIRTVECMRYVFTCATRDNERSLYTFSSVCKRAGIKSSFVSNQDHWGKSNGADTIIFGDCDSKVWLSDNNDQIGNPISRTDGALLPLVEREINSSAEPKIIIVHTIGSHEPVFSKCPSNLVRFPIGTKSDQYDNSVVYTDYILNEIMNLVALHGGDAFMLYFSDHGETPSSKYWRYAKDRDVWEIPMFMWFSNGYKSNYPEVVNYINQIKDEPLNTENLFPILTKLSLIDLQD